MVIMIILEVIRTGNTIRRTSNIDNKILNKKFKIKALFLMLLYKITSGEKLLEPYSCVR